VHKTSDATFHLSVAADGAMSSATAMPPTDITSYDVITSPSRDVRPPSVTPPIDASSFDYVLQLEDLSYLHKTWFDDAAFVPTAVVYGLTFVLGFLGNVFVALALLVDRRQRAVLAAADGGGSHHLTTSFLVSLAIADVVFLLVCLPYELVVKMELVWHGGLALCKLAGFVEMTTASASRRSGAL